jgi:hypothetical protein
LVKIDQLAIEGGRALSCGIERPLQRIDGLFQLLLAALVGLAALVDRLLGESAHALRNGCVELQCLEFLRGLAECVARLLGGGLGSIGVSHGGLPLLGLISPGQRVRPMTGHGPPQYCLVALQYKCCVAITQGVSRTRQHFFSRTDEVFALTLFKKANSPKFSG